EAQIIGVWLPAEDTDEWLNEVLDQRLNDLTECGANDDADGEIDDVAAQQEFLEAANIAARFMQHGTGCVAGHENRPPGVGLSRVVLWSLTRWSCRHSACRVVRQAGVRCACVMRGRGG